jgi:hypothetical protein
MSDVRKVVDDINEKLFNESVSDMDYFRFLELTCTPSGDFIKYMGHFIWDSVNDYREWIDDEQEQLEGYLVKQMIGINKAIVGSLRALDKRYKAIAKVMDSRLKGDELRADILERAQEFVDEQK